MTVIFGLEDFAKYVISKLDATDNKIKEIQNKMAFLDPIVTQLQAALGEITNIKNDQAAAKVKVDALIANFQALKTQLGQVAGLPAEITNIVQLINQGVVELQAIDAAEKTQESDATNA